MEVRIPVQPCGVEILMRDSLLGAKSGRTCEEGEVWPNDRRTKYIHTNGSIDVIPVHEFTF